MYNLWIHLAVLPPARAGGVGINFLARIMSLKKSVGTAEGLTPSHCVWPGQRPHLSSHGNSR